MSWQMNFLTDLLERYSKGSSQRDLFSFVNGLWKSLNCFLEAGEIM